MPAPGRRRRGARFWLTHLPAVSAAALVAFLPYDVVDTRLGLDAIKISELGQLVP